MIISLPMAENLVHSSLFSRVRWTSSSAAHGNCAWYTTGFGGPEIHGWKLAASAVDGSTGSIEQMACSFAFIAAKIGQVGITPFSQETPWVPP
ncbi:hypothetical protein MTO96_047616 [Rhipicephalus appendiculatus]